ncbi:hypothetical protein K501DRAFT_336167 [Backusella circina FSU 941]|nr:hypothetical protein K501DRAFT_336167 [Backusella circina FSU 941]
MAKRSKTRTAELLHQIFTLLHQHDKLECMTVCRQWSNTIENFSLFSTLRIGSMTQMNKLIEKVRHEPTQGARVERLVLDVELDVDFKMDILPFFFPNVQEFLFFNIYERNDNYHMSFTKKLSPHPWYRRIEHITEYATELHTQYILNSGLCTHLKTIVISGTDYDLGFKFISSLANAPGLTTLCMCDFSLAISDLELLHETVPLLHSLTLDDGQIACHTLASDLMRPASVMKKLTLKSILVLFVENEILLLHYICMKYINLFELSYDVMCMNQGIGDMERLYKEGFTRLAETFHSHLGKLSLAFEYQNENPFKMLDDANCQIQELTLGHVVRLPLLEQLARSNQVRFIQALTIDHILDTSTLQWLKEFTTLKELNLYHPYQGSVTQRKVIKLGELFAILGQTLETLRLRTHHLEFDTRHHHRKQYPISHLSFDRTLLPNQIDVFISQTLPKLQTLKFKRCVFEKRSFLLPSMDLSYFEMIESFPQENTYLGVTTLINDEERWYTTKSTYSWDRLGSKDHTVFPAVTSKPFHLMRGSPSFHLVCNSVQNIFMVNTMY